MDSAEPRARLTVAGDAIVVRVERELPRWIEDRIRFIADAWARLDERARAELDQRARDAAETATARVVDDLHALFATDPSEQRTTPLEVVRSAVSDVTAVLAAAGIPPVDRDAFAERAFPDDVYGLTPASFAELGDDELGPLQLEWGLAKAHVLRDS